LAFAFVYFALENAESDQIGDYIVSSYKLNLADYDTDEFTLLEWIVFFAATMINTIIMLNLLIAVFSDTFARVKENRTIADHKELAQLIFEGEIAMFHKRSYTEFKYLHVQTDTEFIIEPDLLSQKFKNLKNKMKHMQDSIAELSQNHNKTTRKVECLQETMEKMHETMMRIEGKIH